MANCVINTTRCSKENIDALNRKAIAETDIQNGTFVNLKWAEDIGDEVFVVDTENDGTEDLWMACSPEVNKLMVGTVYGGLDPRNFVNVAGRPFDVVKLLKGDIIQATKDFFKTGFSPIEVTSGTVVEIVDGEPKVLASATSAYKGLRFKIGRLEPMVFATAGIGGEQVDAWLLEVVQ